MLLNNQSSQSQEEDCGVIHNRDLHTIPPDAI